MKSIMSRFVFSEQHILSPPRVISIKSFAVVYFYSASTYTDLHSPGCLVANPRECA